MNSRHLGNISLPWQYLRLAVFLSCLTPLVAQIPLPRIPDKPITQKLTDGEQQAYQLSLTAGEYLSLAVKYEGIRLSATLQDMQGAPLATWAGGVDTIGNFEAAIIAPATGNYQLVLRGSGTATTAGSYTVTVKALRAATAADHRAAAASRLMLEGQALYDQRTGESRRKALAKYEEVLPLWRANQDAAKEIDTLETIALLHRLLGEPRRGMGVAQEMLPLARQHQLRAKELTALRMIGSLHLFLDEYQDAQTILEQALTLSRTLQDRQMEQSTLNALGVAVASLGQGQTAIGYYQQALQLAQATRDRGSEAGILSNLGTRWSELGEPERALTAYQQSLALYRQLANRDGEARALRRLSTMQLLRGEIQQSLDYARQSLTLAQTASNRPNEAMALQQLGHLQQVLHNPALALNYLNEARTIYEAMESHAEAAQCLAAISKAYLLTGETDKAEASLQQALKIQRRLNRQEETAENLIDLGVVSLKQGKPQQSVAQVTEALTLIRTLKSVQMEPTALLHLSRAHQRLGEHEQARAALQQALPLTQKLNQRLLEAEVQHDLALTALQQQQYDAAQTAINAALQIIEASRIGLLHPEARALYRSSAQSFYEIATDVLVQRTQQQNNPQLVAQALELVERARARSLLDWLSESHIDLRQGVAGDLLKRERELQARATVKTEVIQALGSNAAARTQAKALEAELAKIEAELQDVQSQMRRLSPAYAALTQPQPLKPADIQQQLLDRDTLLLEYALGTERSYLFAVTPTSLKIFVLPKRAEIEAAVRGYYALVAKQSALPVFSNLAQKQKLMQQLERDRQRSAQTLSQMLLQPAAAELAQKRLLLVPDGALHYVPFAALPEPREEEKGRRGEREKGKLNSRRTVLSPASPPLIVRHELLTLPSASTLPIARQHWAKPPATTKLLAVLADPVFGTEDERLTAPTRSNNAEAETQRFARLLNTRQEAAAIMALVPPAQRLVALDFAANRRLAMSEELQAYRYLHFATHGIWSEVSPGLSGLLFSQFDAGGKPQPGLLTTQDVFNLKLTAELVVLSGCQTALGKELRGEGLLGLTRGFLYAGARRVVASLWQVNDVATAQLMEKFYQGMLGKQRLSPAAALRAAQIALWQDKRWSAPHYWAAFTLQGEW